MGVTSASKKRKVHEGMAGRVQPKKKFRKQAAYHSSSEDENENENGNDDFTPVNLLDSDAEQETSTTPNIKGKTSKQTPAIKPSKRAEQDERDDKLDEKDNSEVDSDSEANDDSDEGITDAEDEFPVDEEGENNQKIKKVPKRHDPSVFSTSISKILSTKLSTSARADPVLSRSKTAAQASSELANERLDQRVRAKLRAEKKEEKERGRVRDVLGIERGQAGDTAEEEKRLRKVAQRGVVKLFNAVRAAQVRGEEAAREEQKKGTIGMEERKKAANEVSKQSFLELINGKKGGSLNIEEA
ncbi:DUF1665 domain protein [Talaromyces proteolyticus]|uniref:DUF1665 domain protein n=1 Tax=Talaromyces proteolyticus TaxID=1131652 RepID=A0AAD4L1N4_9EURO|nr:DUF1665 domain protein [Talaromyces proteolyticus]KAH8702225.1 DUF1665 domain protein [Talaromyces proteolyticus]